LLCTLLRRENFVVTPIHDGLEGEQAALSKQHDVIILDIMLPSKDGLEVLRDIRGKIKTPILMLTAKGDDLDRIIGLEMGADDYLPKPFNPRELIARVKALLRRVQMDLADEQAADTELSVSNILLKTKSREVFVDNQKAELTSTEFNVLRTLLTHPNEVISKADLTELSLGRKLSAYDRAIDMHVSNLRKKINGISVQTIRGIGYMYQLSDSSPTS
jgi:two-component system response regulator CpxR